MIPASIRAICFDAVGTLIVPCPAAHLVYAEVGARHGSRYDAAAIRQRFKEAFMHEERADQAAGWKTSEEREYRRWQKIVGTVLDDVADSDSCFQQLYEHFGRPEAWSCCEATAQFLENLHHRGYPLAIASNYDHRLRSVAAGLQPLQHIDHIIISAEVGWRKPSPHFFEAVCRSFNLPPEEILFVGDDFENDFQGARAAGMFAVLVDPEDLETGLSCIGSV